MISCNFLTPTDAKSSVGVSQRNFSPLEFGNPLDSGISSLNLYLTNHIFRGIIIYYDKLLFWEVKL